MKRKRTTLMATFLAVVLLVSYACNAQQWFQLVGALLPILGNTYLSFYAFSQKGGIDAADIAKVQAFTSTGQDITKRIGVLVDDYQKNQNSGTIVEINALIEELKNDVNGFLGDFGIKNSAHFATYKQFADALLADVQDLVNLIPIISPPPGAVGVHAQETRVIRMRVSLPSAKSLENVFKSRLDGLPK